MMKLNKILFILHLPPPIHGAAMVGKFIQESATINNTVISKYINLSTSRSIEEIGQVGLVKWLRYIGIIRKTIIQILIFQPKYIYFTMSAKGAGFYKDALIVFIAKALGSKIIFHFHNKGIIDNQNKKIDNLIYNFVLKNSKVILLSPLLYGDIEKYVKKEDVFYCANGIPLIKHRHSDKVKSNDVEILFISNLMESKGVYILLEALEIVKLTRKEFHCNIIGGEGDISKEVIMREISKRNLEQNVTYRGKQLGKQKSQFLSSADIFLHPTLDDCFPLVLLEALQEGLPIISTNVGAIPEIVENEKSGFIVPKNNSKELALKIEILIEDQNLRVEMGKKGTEKFKKCYSISSFENNFSKILKTLK